MNKKLLSLCILLSSFLSYSQETNVPDNAFENYLETHNANGDVVALGDPSSMGNGVANDGMVTTSAIESVTNLNVHSLGIADLTGIEDFIALENLKCFRNSLTDIDLSQNTELTYLSCSSNNLTSLDVTKNTKLIKLLCSINPIGSLDVTQNILLEELDCVTNQLTSLDLTQNSALIELSCKDNELTSLNLPTNTALKYLYCNNNQLSSLDVTQSILLEELECHDNVLTSLDVSQNTALDSFYFDSNQLTIIDVTNNIALVRIRAQDNALTSLDLSKNITLRHIECQENALTSLDLRNGNNANTRITATDNPNLYCIQVDDVSGTYLNGPFWRKDTHAFYSTDCRQTNVPDAIFEDYLETHNANGDIVALGDPSSMGNGVDNDNAVTTEKIESVTSLRVNSRRINDLTGIEDFLALESLNCTRNLLTNLDFSQNTELAYLWCGDNNLTSLDLTKNTKLIELSCFSNPLGSLDVTQNILLEELNCATNQLTSLDVTQNSALIELSCKDNEITTLDLSQNTALTYVYCNDNQLSSLDVTQNILLEDLECQENALTSLNIRNGNNLNLNTNNFDIRDNPNLICVAVDDPTHANAHFNNKDLQTGYSTFCNTTYVPDDNFETYLETHNSIGGLVAVGDLTSMGNGIANDNYVGTERIKNVTSLDVTNLGILDLTGIEDFIALKSLTCIGNSLTEIDVTKNVALTNLDLYRNALTSIDISQNIQLTSLVVADNQLTSLDISQNIKLDLLYCDFNQLTSLDVTQNTLLTELSCDENELASIDVSKNLILEFLYVRYNQLTALDVSQNVALEELECTDNELASIDLSQNLSLLALYVDENQLTTLDLSKNVALERLVVYDNQLTTLDLSQNVALETLEAYDNQLTTLDLSQNLALETLEAYDNQLTYLTLKNGNNASTFSYVKVTNNPDLSCIEVDDATAATAGTGNYSRWDKDATASFNEDCTAPVITLTGDNPQTIELGVGYTELGAITDDGSLVVIDASGFIDAIGSYIIRYNATDVAGNIATEVTRTVNVTACPIYDLPSDNFQIQIASETCADKNNGTITINATQNHNYTATINTLTYDFTSNLVVENLAPGTYPVCIAIDGNTDCEQCFEIIIEAAALVAGKTTLAAKNGTNLVQVEINSGTAPYTVTINDKVAAEYDTNNFSVEVTNGDTVEVHSSLACEGKISTKIASFDTSTAYPNPTSSSIELTFPTTAENTIPIEIHNAFGIMVSSKEYTISGNKVTVPMEDMPAGIYFVRTNTTAPKTFKILKK